MRINDKILLENIEDYFNHKGLSPHLIDDIKEKVITDIKNSEKKDQDYIEYKKKISSTNHINDSKEFVCFTNESSYFLYYKLHSHILFI